MRKEDYIKLIRVAEGIMKIEEASRILSGCGLDEGDERLAVIVDGEMAHGEVARSLVVRIPVAGEIVGTHGHAAYRQPGSVRGMEKLADDLVPVCFGEQA